MFAFLALAPTADNHFLLAKFYKDTQQTAKSMFHVREAMNLDPDGTSPVLRPYSASTAGFSCGLSSRSRPAPRAAQSMRSLQLAQPVQLHHFTFRIGQHNFDWQTRMPIFQLLKIGSDVE